MAKPTQHSTFNPQHSLATWLYRRPRLVLALLLAPPLLYLLLVYLGSLLALLAQSFFALDDFSGRVVYQPTLRTYASLLDPASLDIIGRTAGMAAAVTLAAAALAFPGVVAGSIFTFSLTLGDFIVPGIVGNSARFIGQAVLEQQGTAGNTPLAAAFTVVPIVIMAAYLLIAKRLGAFDAL